MMKLGHLYRVGNQALKCRSVNGAYANFEGNRFYSTHYCVYLGPDSKLLKRLAGG